MLFNSNVVFGEIIPESKLPDQKDIRHVPQFFRADAEYAYRLGGPVVRTFIDSLPLSNTFKYLSIDIRVHMLMKDWMPCIGGWHCDDFYRPTNDEPRLSAIIKDGAYSKHHTLVIGPIAMTEFIRNSFSISLPDDDILKSRNEHLYGYMSKVINGSIKLNELQIQQCASGQLVHFDCFAFHRGRPAEASAWRMFARATESNHWEPQNEIRTQTQVYLKSFEAGW